MKLDALLKRVEKPSRYIGGEINTFNKPIEDQLIRFCFAFPDVYEVGMSHLGMQIIYRLLNGVEDVFCERVFTPWHDMEALMREGDMPLFSLETKSPLNQMDIIGFTLQYEMSYTNILNMLDMSKIPFLSKDRSDKDPLIVAGGPCAFNPEPLADIVDMFFIGEGEELLIDFIDVYRKYKSGELTRDQLFIACAQIEGIYVPKFYKPIYNEDQTIQSVEISNQAPSVVKKRIVKDLEKGFKLDSMIVPFADIVHDRAFLEIFRGCTRGCRFCQAGMIYRPIRNRNEDSYIESIDQILESTGFEEVSITSLSTMDYPDIDSLVKKMVKKYEDNVIGVSLPSLRLDSLSVDVLQEIQKIRKTGLTFAPEAGTQRLRDVINKGVSEENIEETFKSVFGLGWNRVKLYFMIGLPTENEDDLKGIADIANLGTYLFKQNKPDYMKKAVQVTVSTSCFVPKPFTPFQWMSQESVQGFYDKIDYLKSKLNNRKVVYNYHDPHTSVMEGVFARGDRRLSQVLIKAFELGCKFDGWQEHFNYELWEQAFKACDIDPDFYTIRERSYDEVLPWDVISPGVTKKYLMLENDRAIKGDVTQDCRESCTGCGVNIQILDGVC